MATTSKFGIGFATKFFTLWDVKSEFIFSESNGNYACTGTKTTYSYRGKLSICKAKAIDKVREKGINDFFIDESLRGTRTWTKTEKNYCEIKRSICSVFQFGKYENQMIKSCSDLKYLYWYFEQTSNVYAQQMLLDSGEFGLMQIDHCEKLLPIERCEKINDRISIIDQIKRTNTIEFDCVKNLSPDGTMNIEIDGQYITSVKFPFFKIMTYNGFDYALPCLKKIDLSGKKIKGNKLKLTLVECDQNDPYNFGCQFEVVNWEKI